MIPLNQIPASEIGKATMVAECVRLLMRRHECGTSPYQDVPTVASAMVNVSILDPDSVDMENQLQSFHLFVVSLERELVKRMEGEGVSPLV